MDETMRSRIDHELSRARRNARRFEQMKQALESERAAGRRPPRAPERPQLAARFALRA